MTQDPYGQPPGTGYVARGDVVPDDEAGVNPPTVPMTQFQRVASALRGDPTDPAIPAHVAADAATATSQDTKDTQDTQGAAQDDANRDATRPEEVVAVRSPDAGSHDYWQDASEHAAPQEAAPEHPVSEHPVSEEAVPEEAVPDEAVPDEPAAAGADAAGAAAGAGEPEVVGKHAGAPVQDGLAQEGLAQEGLAQEGLAQEGSRPGESDHGLGDFSDPTYGSLLPDAAEFKAQWRQVQFRFVDDPPGSVTEAADVIARVTAKLEAAIAERQRALRSRWSEGKSTDTESLRETLLMYRAFLDQLTGPTNNRA